MRIVIKKRKREKAHLDYTIDETIVRKALVKAISKKPEHLFILFLKGQLLGKLHGLKKGTTVIGRGSDADIEINDPSVSREHLKIEVTGGKSQKYFLA